MPRKVIQEKNVRIILKGNKQKKSNDIRTGAQNQKRQHSSTYFRTLWSVSASPNITGCT